MNNQLSGLEKFQKQKRESTIQKVKDTIKLLQDEGKDVNFKSVSRHSFITRKTLYKVSEIRELIESVRVPLASVDEQIFLKIKNQLEELQKENEMLKAELELASNLKNAVKELKNHIAQNPLQTLNSYN